MTNEVESTQDSAAPVDLYTSVFDPAVTTEVVAAGRLSVVGARPALTEYLRLLWGRRYFLWAEARAKVTSGTRETVLGQAWLVVKPILDGLAYLVVFGIILGAREGIPNFVGYLVIGVFLFQFTTQVVTGGARSIQAGRNLIRAFSFPRASLPISAVLRGILNLVPVLCAMFLIIILEPTPEVWTPLVLLFPVILVLQTILCTGLALLFARLVAMIPDIKQLISVGMRFWLYASAVFFSIDRFENAPWLQGIMQVNPMFLVLDAARDVILYGVAPEASTWTLLTAWSFGALIVGFVFFWRGEETYGRA